MRRVLVVLVTMCGCATAGTDDPPDAAPLSPDASRPPDARAPDAALVVPDASAPDAALVFDATPDAPVPIDARPPDSRPDGRPDAACVLQLLANEGFEDTTGTGADKAIEPWSTLVTTGNRPYLVATSAELAGLGAAPQAGSYAAHLGGANNVAHQLFQSFDVPAETDRIDITGWFWVRTTESTMPELDDFLRVQLRNDQGTIVETYGTLSEMDKGSGWVERRFQGTAIRHAGQVRSLVLDVTTDPTVATDFFVDSLRVEAFLCL